MRKLLGMARNAVNRRRGGKCYKESTVDERITATFAWPLNMEVSPPPPFLVVCSDSNNNIREKISVFGKSNKTKLTE